MKGYERARQHGGDEKRRSRDGHGAGFATADRLQFLQRALVAVARRLREATQTFGEFGSDHAAAATNEQWNAKLFFETANGLGEGRLGDVQLGRGLAETFCLEDLKEVVQMPELHGITSGYIGRTLIY